MAILIFFFYFKRKTMQFNIDISHTIFSEFTQQGCWLPNIKHWWHSHHESLFQRRSRKEWTCHCIVAKTKCSIKLDQPTILPFIRYDPIYTITLNTTLMYSITLFALEIKMKTKKCSSLITHTHTSRFGYVQKPCNSTENSWNLKMI